MVLFFTVDTTEVQRSKVANQGHPVTFVGVVEFK